VFFSSNVPYDKLSDNPKGFDKPTDRNMSYSELKIRTEDGALIRGYMLVQREKCLEKETIVYFHGGGGNLGLRNDYFGMLYNQLHVNVMCVSFRGYAPSKGVSTE